MPIDAGMSCDELSSVSELNRFKLSKSSAFGGFSVSDGRFGGTIDLDCNRSSVSFRVSSILAMSMGSESLPVSAFRGSVTRLWVL